MNVLISGANRGLGFAIACEYLRRGATVFGAVRDPAGAGELRRLGCGYADRVHLLNFDDAAEATITGLAEQVRSRVNHLDRLVNCAAVYDADGAGWRADGEAQAFGNLDAESALAVWRVNVAAPLLLTQALHDLLRGSLDARVANISSGVGSLAEKTYGGEYYYGTSKAALNFVTRALSADLRGDGVTVVALNPGWVRTAMGGSGAPLAAADVAAAVAATLEGLTPQHSGGFFDRGGRPHAW